MICWDLGTEGNTRFNIRDITHDLFGCKLSKLLCLRPFSDSPNITTCCDLLGLSRLTCILTLILKENINPSGETSQAK